MVAPVVVSGLVSLGASLIDRIFPDKAKADEAKLKLLELEKKGELEVLKSETALALKQGEINVEEAKSGRFTWREGVGWTCAIALFCKYFGGPLVFMIAQFWGVKIELPPIDAMELTPLLIGMLGLPLSQIKFGK